MPPLVIVAAGEHDILDMNSSSIMGSRSRGRAHAEQGARRAISVIAAALPSGCGRPRRDLHAASACAAPGADTHGLACARGQSLVSRKHKLLVCYIPKNGCSTWIKMLHDLVGRNYTGWKSLQLAGGPGKSWEEPLANSVARSELQDITRDASWARIVVVRNPHERLLSLYLDKCVPRLATPLADRRNNCINLNRRYSWRQSAPDFQTWAHMLAIDDVAANPHYQFQTGQCGLGNAQIRQLYSHTLNLSSPRFSADVTQVLQEHGVPTTIVDAYFRRRVAAHSSGNHHVCEYYDESSWAKVSELYSLDYGELFGGAAPSFSATCRPVVIDAHRSRLPEELAALGATITTLPEGRPEEKR